MSKYTFTIQDLLRSTSKWQSMENYWTVPLPDDLIENTWTEFWNFDVAKDWQVFVADTRQVKNELTLNQNRLELAQASAARLSGKLNTLNASLSALTIEKNSISVVTSHSLADTQAGAASLTGDDKLERATKLQIAKINGDIATTQALLDIENANITKYQNEVDSYDAQIKALETAASDLNVASLQQFQKLFLQHFFDSESKYETPGLFKLRLKSWWGEFMPMYSNLLRESMGSNYFVTSHTLATHSALALGSSIDSSSQTNLNNDASSNNGANSGGTNANSNSNSANLDTPQDQLDLNLDNLEYATGVSRDNGKTHSNDLSTSIGENQGASLNTSDNSNTKRSNDNSTSQDETSARNEAITTIIGNWLSGGYSVYLDIFDKLDEHLFLQLF